MDFSSPLVRFRLVLGVFVAGLVLSGVTAFPLLWELRLLASLVGPGYGDLSSWIMTVRDGLENTYAHYPWIAYGTDWLAFGHLIIASFFIAPLVQPRGSRAVIITGIFACLAVFPLALVCGPIRGIPLYWRLIDCSFGAVGILPLIYCLRQLRKIE